MSIKSQNILSAFLVFAILAYASDPKAEIGYGTVEDTRTGEYLRNVQKDWSEGAILDGETGNYVVTYKTWNNYFKSVIFEPATKTDPSIRSDIRYNDRDAKFVYEYKIKNGARAKQAIDTLAIVASNVSSSAVAPSHWEGSVVPTFTDANLRVVWIPDTTAKGLPPKQRLGGFGIESNDLPGIAVMQIKGDAKPTTWLGHSPDIATPVGKQVAALEANDFVARIVAVPKVLVPNPYNTTAVLTGLQKHIKDDMTALNLIEPAFFTQLDRPLQAAIDAAKINNTVGVKQNLQDLRKALKKAHHDVDEGKDDDDDAEYEDPKNKRKPILIDKLAARVIDFDVSYVLKRLSGGKKDN